jgi:hypothetical protein
MFHLVLKLFSSNLSEDGVPMVCRYLGAIILVEAMASQTGVVQADCHPFSCLKSFLNLVAVFTSNFGQDFRFGEIDVTVAKLLMSHDARLGVLASPDVTLVFSHEPIGPVGEPAHHGEYGDRWAVY